MKQFMQAALSKHYANLNSGLAEQQPLAQGASERKRRRLPA